MNTKSKETGFASRLLHGAKDLIWQDEPISNRNARHPDGGVIGKSGEKQAQRLDVSVDMERNVNPLAKDLFAVVMNRPTAYSSLAEAITALSDISMDEATRYRSAFAVLKKTQQRTVAQISQAVDVHTGLLEAEIVRFSSQSRSAEEAEISAREKAVDLLNSDVEQHKAQISALRAETEERIKNLQEEISEKQSRAVELKSETEQKKQSILQTNNDFERAIEIVRARLNHEKEKIQTYLGNATS